MTGIGTPSVNSASIAGQRAMKQRAFFAPTDSRSRASINQFIGLGDHREACGARRGPRSSVPESDTMRLGRVFRWRFAYKGFFSAADLYHHHVTNINLGRAADQRFDSCTISSAASSLPYSHSTQNFLVRLFSLSFINGVRACCPRTSRSMRRDRAGTVLARRKHFTHRRIR